VVVAAMKKKIEEKSSQENIEVKEAK